MGGTLGAGLGLIDGDVTALQGGTIEGLDRRIGLGIAGHLHETKALGLAGELVADELDAVDLAILGEGLAQVGIGGAIRKIAYVDIHICLAENRALEHK